MTLRGALEQLGSLVSESQSEFGTFINHIVKVFEFIFVKAGLALTHGTFDIKSILLKVTKIHAKLARLIQKSVNFELGLRQVNIDEVVGYGLTYFLKLFDVQVGAIDRILINHIN